MKGLDRQTRDHVERGGLLLQRIPPFDFDIEDPTLREIVQYVRILDAVSAVMLQRKFKLTYLRAARYLDELVRRHFIEASKDKLGRHLVIKMRKHEEWCIGGERGPCNCGVESYETSSDRGERSIHD
jgi:hypothetical protein